MNAAFLFHEPLSVSRGQRLDFRYRVLYRDGWWEAPEFAKLADEFTHSAAMNIQQSIDQATQLHRAGRLQDAERIYRQILAVNPKCP